MKPFATIFSVFILLMSCKKEAPLEYPTYYIDLKKGYEIENVSDFIKSYKYIALQTDTNCVLGNIRKVRILNDRIYITDHIKRSLFVFDLSGKFIGKINDVGKGPKEYSYISRFSVSKDYIYLFGDKNLVYDHNLNFVSISPFSGFHYIDKELMGDTVVNYSFGFNPNAHYELQYMHNDRILNNYLKTPSTRTAFFGEGSEQHFYHYKDTILLRRMLNQTIYTLTKEGPKPRYAFDFGIHNPPSDFLAKCQEKDLLYFLKHCTKNKYNCNILRLAENRDYITMFTSTGAVIINKNTQKAGRFAINISDPNLIVAAPNLTYNEKFVSIISALEFNRYFKEIDQDKLLPEIKNLVRSVRFDDNPVIGIYEFNANTKM